MDGSIELHNATNSVALADSEKVIGGSTFLILCFPVAGYIAICLLCDLQLLLNPCDSLLTMLCCLKVEIIIHDGLLSIF